MKYARYMVFRICQYYPAGGLGDCIFSSDDLEEAKKYLDENYLPEEGYVFDRIEGLEVYDRS